MHMQLWDDNLEGAHGGGLDGGREFGQPFKQVLDPLANNVVRDDFVEVGVMMTKYRSKYVVHIHIP